VGYWLEGGLWTEGARLLLFLSFHRFRTNGAVGRPALVGEKAGGKVGETLLYAMQVLSFLRTGYLRLACVLKTKAKGPPTSLTSLQIPHRT